MIRAMKAKQICLREPRPHIRIKTIIGKEHSDDGVAKQENRPVGL